MEGFGSFMDIAGSLFNNGINIAADVSELSKLAEAGKISQDQLRQFVQMRELHPEWLQMVAEQAKTQPDIGASGQRNDQINALRQLQNVASSGGLDDSAIAANQASGMDAARQFQAQSGAINNSLARRGLNAGSGAELAQKQMAAQSAYNTQAMEGAQNAANAQVRALSAIRDSGRLAGDIASSEEERLAQNAERKAATDRYNTSIRNAVNQANANAVLQAQQSNIALNSARNSAAQGNVNTQVNSSKAAKDLAEDAGERTQDSFSTFGQASGFGKGKK